MRSTFTRSITALILVIAMAVGMTASYQRKAYAASPITVKWDGNGGKNKQGQSYHYSYYNQSSVWIKPSSTIYTRSNYTLSGFSVNGKFYNVGASFQITSDTTIKCIWEANKSRIKLKRYITGQITTAVFPTGTKVKYDQLKVGAIGYHPQFYTSSSYTTLVSFPYKLNSDTTMYYKLCPNTCDITFSYDGNTKKVTRMTGEKLGGPELSHSNEVFLGWSTDPEGSSGIYRRDHICSFSENGSKLTLYAIWLSKNKESQDIVLRLNQSDLLNVAAAIESRTKHLYRDYSNSKSDTEWTNSLKNKASGGIAIAGAILSVPFPVSGCVITCFGLLLSTYMKPNNTKLSEAEFVVETYKLDSSHTAMLGAANSLGGDYEEIKATVTATYINNTNYYWEYRFYSK